MKDLTWSNISLENLPEDLMPELINQINKDFEEHSLNSVSDKYLVEDLINSIKGYLLNQSKRGADFQHLLYRIDVPENEVQMVLQERDLDKLCFNLSRLILKRELQKVLIRRYFKDAN